MQSYPYPVEYCQIKSHKIAYMDLGTKKGPVLIFVHGLGSNALCWLKNIESLSATYRCIAIDLPGYGLSESLEITTGVIEYADLLNDFIKKLKAEQVFLVGHSMGAQIGVHLYLKNPKTIQGLILLAPAGFETFNESEKFMITNMNRPEMVQNLNADQIQQVYQANFKKATADMKFMISDRIELMEDATSYKAYLELVFTNVQSMLKEAIFNSLDKVDIPVLVLFGADDLMIPNRMLHPMESTKTIAEIGVSRMPNASYEIVPAAGHFLHWDQHKKVNELVQQWVSDQIYELKS